MINYFIFFIFGMRVIRQKYCVMDPETLGSNLGSDTNWETTVNMS